MKTVGQRIRYARVRKHLTQEQLADQVGVERGAVGNWERDRGIKTENILRVATLLDVPVEWLSKGKGPAPNGESQDDTAAAATDDFGAIANGLHYKSKIPGARPEIDVRAGAGQGAVGEHEIVGVGARGTVTGHRVLAEWLFPAAFLRSELKALPDRIIVIEVQGDSMVPTLHPGERVIVDTGQATFGPDAIYIIDDGDGEPQVKRLRKVQTTDRIEIWSDNPAAQRNDDIVSRDQLRIVGRVVGRISRL